MTFKDRAKTMRPDLGVLVPIIILFVSSLNGPNLPEALRNNLNLFFSPGTGWVFWGQALVLNLILYIYFSPVFFIHIKCLHSCDPAPERVDLALRRLNGLYAFAIAASVLTFVAGKTILMLRSPAIAAATGANPGWGTVGYRSILVGEAAINGFFVGVIMAIQFENRLFSARETILKLNPAVPTAYLSLFFKVFMILMAIVLFMTLQAFNFAGSFFSLGILRTDTAAQQGTGFLSGPEIFFQSRRFEGLKEALNVFGLRMLILGLFVAQMMYQLKRLIKRPLATIQERLESLNSSKPDESESIDIVQNDEFAAVYRQINSLIQRQQGQLILSRKRLEAIVANAADPIIAYDEKNTVRLFNPAAETLFGHASSEVLGKNLDAFLGSHVAGSSLGNSLDKSLESGRFEWRHHDGTRCLLEAHLSRENAENAWTTAILHDITKQNDFEENLRKAKVNAENASRMKSEFLANMSHELRTPLNAVLGFTQLLSDDRNLTEAQKEKIGIISRSGEHLLALINDILDISKIEAGRMELHQTVFNLGEFIGDLRDMFALKCKKKGLSLYVELLDDLPAYVEGDLGKIRQVLVNLLSNAVKFTAEGGVSILVGKEPTADSALVGRADGSGEKDLKPAPRILFVIRDTGRGIPKDELDLILLPFVQASTTDHEGGTGLGLAISHRFIQMMGGELRVESTLGEGSIFSFSLPLRESTDAPSDTAEFRFTIEVPPEAKASVLVVDDQATNRLVLREMLERVGFLVTEAENGKVALERALASPPSIIFMDIKMPVMDGYAAVTEMKKNAGLSLVPVFALTASAFQHDKSRIRAAGFDGFLSKPFKQAALFRLIKEKSGLDLNYIAKSYHPDLPLRTDVESSKPEHLEFGAAFAYLGREGLERLENAALINDFSQLSEIAAEIVPVEPHLAQALKAAADSYDEAALARLVGDLKSKGPEAE